MRKSTSVALIVIITVLLLTSFYGQFWVLPSTVFSVERQFPEVEPIVLPAIVWGCVAVFCLQLFAFVALGFVVRARRFGVQHTYGWIRTMIVILLVFVVIVAGAFVALSMNGYSAPAMLGLLGVAILGLLAAGALALYLGTRMTLPKKDLARS